MNTDGGNNYSIEKCETIETLVKLWLILGKIYFV